jgi:hypothetical protein
VVTRKTIALVAVALLGAGCARSGPGGDDLTVVPLEGDVFLLDGDDRKSVERVEPVGPGAIVETGDEGRARVVLADGRAVELALRSALRVDSVSSTDLLKGKALIEAPSPVTVTSGAARISGSGAFRIDRFVGALRVGVYAGGATVQGWDGRVASLEQVGVAAGIVPEAPLPLQVDPSDAWDARKLGDAIDLGLELEDLQRGLKPQLDADATPATLAGVLPAAFPSKGSEPHLRGVEPSEALVAAMLAIQAAREGDISTLRALQAVIGLRELGASWIIVVARWELYTRAILTALARVAGLIASQLVPVVATGGTDAGSAGPGPSGGTTSGGTTTSGGSSSPPDGGTDPGDGGTDPGDGGTDPGDGGGDPPTCGSDVECAVEEVIGETGSLTDDLGLNP